MKTFTVSADPELHRRYQGLCLERETSLSKEFQIFMKSELDGNKNSFKDLQNQVSNLEEVVKSLISKKKLEVALTPLLEFIGANNKVGF